MVIQNTQIIRISVILFFGILISAIVILSVFNNDLFLLLFAVIILALSYIPFSLKNTNIFSIWSWIFYSVILGVLIRSVYLIFELADINILREVFLREKEIIDFVYPTILILISFVTLILGYLSCKKMYIIKNFNLLNDEWNKNRYIQITLILLIISYLSLYFFVQSNGGFLSGIISAARGVSDTLQDTNPQGYLRLLSSLGFINIFLTLSWLKKSKKLKFYSLLIFILSLIGFLIFNFFVSQRGAVVFVFVQIVAFNYYTSKNKISVKSLVIFAFIALSLFEIMSIFRYNKEFDVNNIGFSVIKKFEPAILTISFIDISKTAHIIDAIPEKLPYAFGSTYITFLYAPIPRSIWKSKPVVNVDNIVGQKVYGSKYFGAGGTPAGLIAEAYWNFWLFGILIIPFIIGYILKYIENTFLYYKNKINVIIIYITCFMFLGLSFMGSSFSSTIVGFLKLFLPILFILIYISKQKYVKR